MIVGAFYVKDGEDHKAIPVFVNDSLDFVGLADITAEEMRFVIAWSMRESDDDVVEMASVLGPRFISLYGNKYYPRKGTPTPDVVYLCLFKGYDKLYTSEDIWNAITVSDAKQRKYWADLKAEISSLTDDKKSVILAAYRAFGKQVKQAAQYLNMDRQLVKQVVFQQTGEYEWE